MGKADQVEEVLKEAKLNESYTHIVEFQVTSHDETKVKNERLETTTKTRFTTLVFCGEDARAVGRSISHLEKAEIIGKLQLKSVP